MIPTVIFMDLSWAARARPTARRVSEGLEVEVVTHPVLGGRPRAYTDSKRGLDKVVFERASRRVVRHPRGNRPPPEIAQALAVAMNLARPSTTLPACTTRTRASARA